VLHEQDYAGDIDLNGVVDMSDFALFASAWKSRFGQGHWNRRCDLQADGDLVIDTADLRAFAGDWLGIEKWHPKNDY